MVMYEASIFHDIIFLRYKHIRVYNNKNNFKKRLEIVILRAFMRFIRVYNIKNNVKKEVRNRNFEGLHGLNKKIERF